MYPLLLPLFPLLSVDDPYLVVIHPSSYFAQTLILPLESFLMFSILQVSFYVVIIDKDRLRIRRHF